MVSISWNGCFEQALTGGGSASYLWNMDKDTVEWQGDLHIPPGVDGKPESSASLHKMINPQDVPRRLAAIHALTEGPPDARRPKVFSTGYRLSRANGTQIDVHESGTLHRDPESGDRILCGFI